MDDKRSQKKEPEKDYYFEHGLMVMTEAYHFKRGYCCNSGCRHCPYPDKEKKFTHPDNVVGQIEYLDQANRKVFIKKPIRRIISLVPSITELIFDLNGGELLVGRTKFCVHPKNKVNQVTIIGGTKNLRHESIHQLNPDLIIANKEENNREDIEMLERHFPIFVTNVPSVAASYEMTSLLGQVFDESDRSERLIFQQQKILSQSLNKPKRRTLYLIWKKPYMSVGGDTYIHDMMDRLGYMNIMAHLARYPEISIEEMKTLNPEIILLSSEPFPFKEKHVLELNTHLPDTEIQLVDGELFSWYGSRLIHLNI